MGITYRGPRVAARPVRAHGTRASGSAISARGPASVAELVVDDRRGLNVHLTRSKESHVFVKGTAMLPMPGCQ